MRVLLVNTNRERSPQPVIPLGLCLVASALSARGLEPDVLDLCFSRRPEVDLARSISETRPDVIGLSVRNLDNGDYLQTREYLPDAAALVRLCRALSPAPIVIGGPAVNVAPGRALEILGADYALAGEGEEAMPELLGHLSAGAGLSDLPYVCSRGGNTASLARVRDINAIPFSQAGRWIDLRRYLRWGAAYPIQTKRGCPFECIYCTYRFIEGGAHRLRSPESVADEIAEARGKWGARSFEFVDAVFDCPTDHALAVCEAIARRDLRVRLTTSNLNPAGATPELLKLMRRAGFRAVVCTPDSGSDEMLLRLRKGFTVAQVASVAAWAREAGLSVLWTFLFGGPGETEETVRETISFMETALDSRDRILCTVGLRVYPDTELARIARAEGAVAEAADLVKPTFYLSPHISAERVRELLDASSRWPQMVPLNVLQQPLVAWALRLHGALGLRGAPWLAVPIYNRLRRALGRDRAS
jgi:radical SAM superfamily enzyme YgiQ (UPF0313 family)